MKKLLLIYSVILFVSCKEETEAPFNNNDFYAEYDSKNWSEQLIKDKLTGRWQLLYIYCCFEANSTAWKDLKDENIEYVFEEDSIKVIKNNILQNTHRWNLESKNANSFSINTEEYVEGTMGTIYFYDKYLLFHASPYDGPDTYYEKIR